MQYETQQRKDLTLFFAAHPAGQFAIGELACQLKGISLSALYRNINRMVAEGVVRRFHSEGQQKFLYQYIGGDECGQHLHLKCNGCGQIVHADYEAAKMITDAVERSTGFAVDKQATILLGSCGFCKS